MSDRLRLIVNQRLIEKFIGEFQISPLSMREVQIFAGDHTFYMSDQGGQRLNYRALTDREWIIRSFGPDGLENTLLSAPDAWEASFEQIPAGGERYLYPGHPHFYPASLLAGYLSSDRKKYARLYQHDYLGVSQLVVRGMKEEGFFMAAFHDRVEEFFWLPDSTSIVFSGVGSQRYRDGIYLWNLKSNTALQLIGRADMSVWEKDKSREQQWFISLSGLDPEREILFSFVRPRLENSLPLESFFTVRSLRAFSLADGGSEIPDIARSQKLSPAGLRAGLKSLSCDSGDSLQDEWCGLPQRGAFEGVLDAWQGYSQTASSSPVFPYSMWVLSLVYHDAFALWGRLSASQRKKLSQEKVEDILASYGAEIAQTLGEQPLTPHWIRAMAVYFWEMFVARESLSFRLTDLVLQPQDKD